jgi:hypothetical protein
MCCSNGDAQAKGLCGGSAVADCAKEPATTPLKAAEEALSAKAAQFSQHWHPSSWELGSIVHPSTTAHMWQPSSGSLQHQRLPQGGLPVTQQTFFQPTAGLFKVLQGSFQHCAVPTLHPTPLPAPAATSRKHPPHPPRRLPHSKSSHQPPHAAQTHEDRWQRTPICHTSRHRQTLQQPAPPLHMPPLCTQQSQAQHQLQHLQQLTKAAMPNSIC